MLYKRFEERPCWQAARNLCQFVNGLTTRDVFKKDFSLKDQISRSAGSVMDNIAEGFRSGSSKAFISFLGYSQRSSSEVQSQLYRALDCRYTDSTDNL
jgi:four helix bundle protein